MSDLIRGVKAVLENVERYQDAEDYYTGCVGEIFANAKMRRLLERTGEAYKINLAKTAVDVVADRLSIAAVTVPDSATETETLQTEVWDANQLLMLSPDIMRKACEYGDAYVMVWPGEEDNTVRLIFNNPKATRVMYDVENEQDPEFAIKLWLDPSLKRWRATLYYADRIERWVTAGENDKPEIESSWIHLTSEIDEDGEAVWPSPNPYGQIPIFHFRTAFTYGVPEHKEAYGPQNAINKLIVTQMSTTDYHGFPQRYALAEGSSVDGDDAADWGDADEDATETTGQQSKLRAGPGELWFLEGVKGTGQFEPADPKNFMDPLEVYVRLMAQVTTTPLHYFDPSGDQPSGEALRTAEAPLNKKVEYRQASFASTWSEVFTFSLAVLGITGRKVDVRWAPAASVEDKEGWEVVAAKIAAGVPRRQALLESGYTAEQLDDWGITENETTPAIPAA